MRASKQQLTLNVTPDISYIWIYWIHVHDVMFCWRQRQNELTKFQSLTMCKIESCDITVLLNFFLEKNKHQNVIKLSCSWLIIIQECQYLIFSVRSDILISITGLCCFRSTTANCTSADEALYSVLRTVL